MAVTRDQAYQQYKAAYGSNFDADAEQDFEHNWANASADSNPGGGAGGYSGAGYGTTWDQQMANVRNRVNERFNTSTDYRTADSQSAAGDALYGSGSNNPRNIPGQMGTATGYNGGPGFGSGMGTSFQYSSRGGGGSSGGGALSAGSTAGQADSLINMLMGRMGGQGGMGGQASGQASAGLNPAFNDFRSMLLNEMQGQIAANKGGVAYGDVEANPEAQAFRLASQRQYDRSRSRLAQRAAAEGTNIGGDFSGSADVDMGQLDQQRAEREGTFEGQLAGRMLTDKKDRLEKALAMGAGYLGDADRLYLQSQLQNVNASIQQQQVGLSLLGQLMGNTHFYDSLGYSLGGQEASLNAAAMRDLY